MPEEENVAPELYPMMVDRNPDIIRNWVNELAQKGYRLHSFGYCPSSGGGPWYAVMEHPDIVSRMKQS